MTAPSPASRFGAYEILYELKSGGMGAVLLARRRGPGAFEQLVAIKTIRPEHAKSPAVRAMFLDEAAILARLNHPGIAHVHDFGEEGGTLYMVMEYVAGVAFRDLIELRPPPAILARAIAEAARGLHAAHEARDLAGTPLGLVHRDISPDNLMLGYDGHVKVIDFGIALVKNRQAPVTEFGTLKGKPPYMSPEQIKNDPMDRRSDVFSLAVVLWELLTGQALFEGDSIYAVALAVEQQAIAPPSRALGEELPLGLDAAVMNALDRELARRTPTAAAFADSLEQVVAAADPESLAAWTDRVLAARREEHREWLARIVGGRDEPPRAIGRPTGMVTAVATPSGLPPVPAAPPVIEPAARDPEPGPGTSIGRSDGDDRLEAAPRRRLGPLAALLVLLVAGGGVAVVLATRHPAGASMPRDAGVVTAPRDAAVPVIAMIPPDAGTPAPVAPDAAEPPRDAGAPAHHLRTVRVTHEPHPVAHPPADAAVASPVPPQPSGTGYLKATSAGVFLNVLIDGRYVGPTPILKPHPMPAGHHVVELVRPDTGEVVLHREIDVRDGQTISIEH